MPLARREAHGREMGTGCSHDHLFLLTFSPHLTFSASRISTYRPQEAIMHQIPSSARSLLRAPRNASAFAFQTCRLIRARICRCPLSTYCRLCPPRPCVPRPTTHCCSSRPCRTSPSYTFSTINASDVLLAYAAAAKSLSAPTGAQIF